jgi:hypothetical protein
VVVLRKAAFGATVMVGAAFLAAAPASAATLSRPAITQPNTTNSGWIGNCYPSGGDNWGGGWCDGNGPDYVYQGYVRCTTLGSEYWGPVRWAGDRRGSFGYCPANTFMISYDVLGFYVGP